MQAPCRLGLCQHSECKRGKLHHCIQESTFQSRGGFAFKNNMEIFSRWEEEYLSPGNGNFWRGISSQGYKNLKLILHHHFPSGSRVRRQDKNLYTLIQSAGLQSELQP